jgi:hypothetical protein
MEHTFKFSVSHAADSAFDGGLREFFEYRDLGPSRFYRRATHTFPLHSTCPERYPSASA